MEIGRVQDPAMPERATPNETAISGAERDFSLLARWPSAASPWRGEGGRAGGGGGGGEQSGVPITEPKLCLAGRQNKARGARGERRQRGRELFVPQRAPLDGADAHARSLQWRLARERAEIAQPMAALAERASGGRGRRRIFLHLKINASSAATWDKFRQNLARRSEGRGSAAGVGRRACAKPGVTLG